MQSQHFLQSKLKYKERALQFLSHTVNRDCSPKGFLFDKQCTVLINYLTGLYKSGLVDFTHSFLQGDRGSINTSSGGISAGDTAEGV